MTTANDKQVAGQHYKAAFQHWDWVQSLSLAYLPAQVTKYLTRWRKKNGLQDLEKAAHFLAKYREEVEKFHFEEDKLTDMFIAENGLEGSPESFAIRVIARASLPSRSMLKVAAETLAKLIATERKEEGWEESSGR